jgi:hypothetical protein
MAVSAMFGAVPRLFARRFGVHPGSDGTESGLPSAVLELANLYVAFARDGVDGTQEAPSFDDAVWLHHLFDRIAQSSRDGERQTVE